MASSLASRDVAIRCSSVPVSECQKPSVSVQRCSFSSHALPRASLTLHNQNGALRYSQLWAFHLPIDRPQISQRTSACCLQPMGCHPSRPISHSFCFRPLQHTTAALQSMSQPLTGRGNPVCRASGDSQDSSEKGSSQTGSSNSRAPESGPILVSTSQIATVRKPAAVTSSGLPESSYYPRGYEYMEELEEPDWRPLYWILAGAALIWSFRDTIAAEIAKWPAYAQVGSQRATLVLSTVFIWGVEAFLRFFGAPALLFVQVVDKIVTFLSRNYAMLVDLMPAWPVVASLLLVSLTISIADVALPQLEKPVLRRTFLPAGVLSLGMVFGMLHPSNFLIGLGLLTLVTTLSSRPSALTAVTPAVASLMAAAESWAFRGVLLALYLVLAIGTKRRKDWGVEREGGNESSHGERESLEQPFLLKVAAFVVGAVLLRRWVGELLLRWQLL